MQIPKLLWLKTHRPTVFHQATAFMDLCDFLSWKATGQASRSMCAVVCKWLYQVDPTNPSAHGWDSGIFGAIGLEELCHDNFQRIGDDIRAPGQPTKSGISQAGADALGLAMGTAVATSLIDAHAGGLALAFCRPGGVAHPPVDWTTRLGLICGTSTCYMQCSKKPVFVPGVWGPYYSAMISGAWLTEAGQVIGHF